MCVWNWFKDDIRQDCLMIYSRNTSPTKIGKWDNLFERKMDHLRTLACVKKDWAESVVNTIVDYVKIPNQSPEYDSLWETNGHVDKALDLLVSWVKSQNITELSLEVLKEPHRTPLIFLRLPSHKCSTEESVLMYGHMDKQPPLTEEWSNGLHPYRPIIRDGKLYGRGSADDGYAIFSAVTAIKAIKEQGIAHPRISVVIEAGEESGSPDLLYYMTKLYPQLGKVGLIVCLDSGCGNYDQFWLTNSLRGVAGGVLEVRILREGVHSGDASGIVPSSFRILRLLLDRLEDSKTGKLLLPELYIDIPEEVVNQALAASKALGDSVWNKHPFVKGSRPITLDGTELILNRTWRPQLSVTGASGMPPVDKAGNVLRALTSVKLSCRIPPGVSSAKAMDAMKVLLESDPPYGAQVSFTPDEPCDGWKAPPLADWLEQSINHATNLFFHNPCVQTGEGGSIPFMAMLGEQFPEAQFVITGVLGPESNAHGPNEFLHLEMAEKVTCCIAHLLHDFVRAKGPK